MSKAQPIKQNAHLSKWYLQKFNLYFDGRRRYLKPKSLAIRDQDRVIHIIIHIIIHISKGISHLIRCYPFRNKTIWNYGVCFNRVRVNWLNWVNRGVHEIYYCASILKFVHTCFSETINYVLTTLPLEVVDGKTKHNFIIWKLQL